MNRGNRFVLWVLLLWAPSGVTNLFHFSRIINVVLIRSTSTSTSTSLSSGRRKIFLFRFLSSHPISLTAGTSSCETGVLTAVLMKVRVLWDITPCRLINRCLLVLRLLDHGREGSSILWNVGNYLPVDMALHSGRLECSSSFSLCKLRRWYWAVPISPTVWKSVNQQNVNSFILSSIKYRVIQEESALLWEMIVWVILSKKVQTNMGPILNGYGVMGIF